MAVKKEIALLSENETRRTPDDVADRVELMLFYVQVLTVAFYRRYVTVELQFIPHPIVVVSYVWKIRVSCLCPSENLASCATRVRYIKKSIQLDLTVTSGKEEKGAYYSS